MNSRASLIGMLLLHTCLRADSAPSFTGTWETTYGRMTLTQEKDKATGFYVYGGVRSSIKGTIKDNRLTFTYREPQTEGEGWFELSKDGQSFMGQWRPKGTKAWGKWQGKRVKVPTGFVGLWSTRYGKMRLIETKDGIRGIYGARGVSTIAGTVKDGKLTFTYSEPSVSGEGSFVLNKAGTGFTGKWREKGTTQWANWNGTRIQPVAGRRWLVILEARWEQDITQQEFSFGEMLRKFFARSE